METLTENLLNERHSVGSIMSGSPEVLHTTTQWIYPPLFELCEMAPWPT